MSKANFKPYKFGRYTILNSIAIGGMAEVFRACLTESLGNGSERILTVKKIIANYSTNPDFIRMFEEEIKITAGLTHSNIIQIYDYSRIDGSSFLVMEYVEGRNLREFLNGLANEKLMLPIDMSCYIISQVCHALKHAHSHCDRVTGKNSNIIHRDVSPQNIMISYEGAVKLFDFGIAKAQSSEVTQAGIIKGKPAYLSPEQAKGMELDGRSDIFSLGTVLWELLTCKRLFLDKNDMAILQNIQSKEIELPSKYNPSIPSELDAIVMKVLERDRDKRYKDADLLQRDLQNVLYSYNPKFNPADLSYQVTKIFSGEIKKDRRKLQIALKISLEDSDEQSSESTIELERKGISSGHKFSIDVIQEMVQTKSRSLVQDYGLDIDLKNISKNISSDSKNSEEEKDRDKDDSKVFSESDCFENDKENFGTFSGPDRSRNNSSRKKSFFISDFISNNFALVSLIALLFSFFTFTHISPGTFFFITKYAQNTVLDGVIAFPKDRSGFGDSSSTDDSSAVSNSKSVDSSKNLSTALDDSDYILIRGSVKNLKVKVNNIRTPVIKSQFPIRRNIASSVILSKKGYDPILYNFNGRQGSMVIKPAFRRTKMGFLNFFTKPGADITLRHENPARSPVSLYTPQYKYELPEGNYTVTIENTNINYKSEIKIRIRSGRITEVDKNL